jgi:hypothetical protein
MATTVYVLFHETNTGHSEESDGYVEAVYATEAAADAARLAAIRDPCTTFVHIGDFHAAPGPRNADRYRALDQIIATGEQPNLGAWLWPGDLNHGRMTIEDRNALAERCARMAAIGARRHLLRQPRRARRPRRVRRLKATHPIYVVATPRRPRVNSLRSTGEHASIFVLPYPTKAGLVAAGVQHDDIIPTAADALDAIFMQAAAQLEAARRPAT